MEFTKLLKSDDKRAVSPVIGVILMVAITVILAAVIGTFVLGLGDQVDATAPNANYDANSYTFDVNDGGGGFEVEGATGLVLTHSSGDALQEDNIDITVNGVTAHAADDGSASEYDNDASVFNATEIWSSNDRVTAGDSVAIVGATEDDVDQMDGFGSDEYTDEGDTIRVVWTSDGGDQSSTLFTREL